MAVELVTGLSIFKSLFDMTKGLKDINDAAVRNAAVIDLQEKIFAAQSAQSALIEHVRELEAEVTRLKTWDTEKQRYELKKWGDGAFVRVLKESEARGEPIHAICPNCYEDGVKSLLQSNREPQWPKHAWCCQRCKAAVKASSQSLNPPLDA